MRSCHKTILNPGDRFGAWTVIEKDNEESAKRKYTMYLCKCDCGTVQSVRASRLTNGYTTNCAKCGLLKQSKTRRVGNKYDLSGEYGIGWTTNTNKPFKFDLDMYDKIKNYTWYENTTTGYVTTQAFGRTKDLHRFVMDATDGEYVDHIHGNESKMDNRLCNLRLATKSQNNINTGLRKNNKSGVTGVLWRPYANKWEARIGYQKKTVSLGLFDDFNEAVSARKEAEIKYYGEYSYDYSQQMNKEEKENGICKSKERKGLA